MMEDVNIAFNYSFSSGLGPMEGYRYVREIYVEIINTDDEGKPTEKIGHAKFKMIYIELADENNYNIENVLDSYEYTHRCAEQFFDFETLDFKASIYKHYKNEIYSKNVCLLERLEIIPKYRGLHIGAKVIKDFIFHFSAGCGLFIVQAYPLQFEVSNRESSQWAKQLEIEKLEKDKANAFKKLIAYYKRCGFDNIKGIKDLLFYNPALKNKYLDAIDLEE